MLGVAAHVDPVVPATHALGMRARRYTDRELAQVRIADRHRVGASRIQLVHARIGGDQHEAQLVFERRQFGAERSIARRAGTSDSTGRMATFTPVKPRSVAFVWAKNARISISVSSEPSA